MIGQSNHPPLDGMGFACMILKRANGEIEIRGASPEHLWAEQTKHDGYAFNGHEQFNETIWRVTGNKI